MKLNIRIAESFESVKVRSLDAARKIDAGQEIEPLCEIGIDSLPQFLDVFTPKRWELIAMLRDAGPVTIYALAKRLKRHYRNVYKDVAKLREWMVIEKDESGRVFVPWDEIDLYLPLKSPTANQAA
jgi:predicted transcriptional regulator